MHVLTKVKSQIIRVVQDYFMKIINKQKLWVATYNVNVTLLINGTTIHCLLKLSIDKHNFNISKSNSIIKYGPIPIHHY